MAYKHTLAVVGSSQGPAQEVGSLHEDRKPSSAIQIDLLGGSKGGTLEESWGISAGLSITGVCARRGMAPLTPSSLSCSSSSSVTWGTTPGPPWGADRSANFPTDSLPDPTASEHDHDLAHSKRQDKAAPTTGRGVVVAGQKHVLPGSTVRFPLTELGATAPLFIGGLREDGHILTQGRKGCDLAGCA